MGGTGEAGPYFYLKNEIMIESKISFRSSNTGLTCYGVITDKVNIPLASGTNQYVPMDNYVVEEYNEDFSESKGTIHIVNPIFIIGVITVDNKNPLSTSSLEPNTDKLKEILNILNEYWRCLPKSSMPNHKDFNKILKIGVNKEILRDLEKANPKVGLAHFDTENEGISTLSFIATITDLFGGMRLAAKIDEQTDQIIGWEFIDISKNPSNSHF